MQLLLALLHAMNARNATRALDSAPEVALDAGEAQFSRAAYAAALVASVIASMVAAKLLVERSRAPRDEQQQPPPPQPAAPPPYAGGASLSGELGTGTAHKSGSSELLAALFSSLRCVMPTRSDDACKRDCETAKPVPDKHPLVADEERAEAGAEESASMRSSHSYIKSLMDALARVHRSRPTSGADAAAACAPLAFTDAKLADATGDELDASGEPADSAESSMDISAAHLILAYLERHLNEREQLARDWIQVCSRHARANSPPAVRKFARVAQLPANAGKNRSPDALPFDRNRVKLRVGVSGELANSSNYINASFLHDDEPRAPTHIIAQAPLDVTLAHFWQVSLSN